jgi:hypothetical protein
LARQYFAPVSRHSYTTCPTEILNTHLDTRGLACAYFIDSKRGVLDVETLQATAIPSSWLGRHESFYEAVFQFRKWALSQRGDGKLELQVKFARIALGPEQDRNSRITVNYGANSMIFGRATWTTFEDYASYVGKV